MNPIFIEYYSHEECDCYKIKLPWPHYAEEKIVLCPVERGIKQATKFAKEILTRHLNKVLSEPIINSMNPKKICKKCGSTVIKGFCSDETCPYENHKQNIDIRDLYESKVK